MTREAINTATKTVTHWLAHYKPASVIAVDEDGQEHPISVTKNKRKYHIVTKAIEELDAVSVRCIAADGSVLATRKLRTVQIAPDEVETGATPATAGGYDVTAVVQCVAKEVREAVSESIKQMRDMVADVVREQSKMLKDMSERHSAAEKALLEAREQIMLEREERIEEREASAERAEKQAEQEQQKQVVGLVEKVVGMAMQNPELVSKFVNGKAAAPKIAATVTPAAPPVKPDA